MNRPDHRVGAAGAPGFARSVTDRSREIRAARIRSIGLVFRSRARRGSPLFWFDRRMTRIEPHIHLRVFRNDVRRTVRTGAVWAPVLRRTVAAPPTDPPRGAPVRPLARALLRHPAVKPVRGAVGAAGTLRTERRRVVRWWTTVAERSVGRLFRRLMERTERVDAVTTTGVTRSTVRRAPAMPGESSSATHAPSIPVSVPVRRVLRRVAPEVVETVEPPPERTGPQTVTLPTRTHGSAAHAEVGLNVEKLTDRVVKAIDRRLVAHRERMGRV